MLAASQLGLYPKFLGCFGLRQQESMSQSRASFEWAGPCLGVSHACTPRRAPLRKEMQQQQTEETRFFCKTNTHQHPPPITTPLLLLLLSSPPLLHPPTSRPRDTGVCGSCRFSTPPVTTSPLHRTTPPDIPRQHVQLDEQPVSTNCLPSFILHSGQKSGFYYWSTHWQSRL